MAIVESHMSFLEPWVGKQDPPYVRGKVEESFPAKNFTNREFLVEFHDARAAKDTFELDVHGFSFYNHAPISKETIEAIRARNKTVVAETYYPLIESLVKRKTGASKVIIFDHTYRKRDTSLAPGENPDGREQPATLVRLV